MIDITIKGAYGETNFGDDLLMCVFENYFHKEFSELSLNFEGEEEEYPNFFLKNSHYNNHDNNSKWLIYGGGTQFFSFKKKKSVIDYFRSIEFILKNPYIIKNKLFRKKNECEYEKVAYLGFGLGPFSNNIKGEENAKNNLEKADFIGVRDFVSEKYCNKWGIRCFLGGDVVFSSYFNKFLRDFNSFEKKQNNKKKIGIIVRDWDWEKSGGSYIEKLTEFYKKDKTNDYQVIVFAPKKDVKWINNLRGENLLIWDPNNFSIEDFLRLLNDFDGFITARYHGAIIASLLGKPVVCIEVEQKLRILTEQIPNMKIWEKPFNISVLENLVQNIDYGVDYQDQILEMRNKADDMLLAFKNKFYD